MMMSFGIQIRQHKYRIVQITRSSSLKCHRNCLRHVPLMKKTILNGRASRSILWGHLTTDTVLLGQDETFKREEPVCQKESWRSKLISYWLRRILQFLTEKSTFQVFRLMWLMQNLGFEEVLPSKATVRLQNNEMTPMVGPVGTFQTCFNMLKIFLGIGILATPETFKKIGLVGGVFGLMIIGLLNGYTMML